MDCDALRDGQWERIKDCVPGGTKGKRGPRTNNRGRNKSGAKSYDRANGPNAHVALGVDLQVIEVDAIEMNCSASHRRRPSF